MIPAYPESVAILAQVTAGWVDITSYVIEDINGGWGLEDNGPLDLVGETGPLELTLNNQSGLFLPGMSGTLAGWKKGIGIKLVITFDGESYVRWKGNIKNIAPPSGAVDDWQIRVSCVDWMEYAAKHPIVNPGILTNQRGDDVINTTLGLMPIQPAAKTLDAGVSVFPTSFDTVTSHTKALSELSKVAFSEVGRVYLRKDRVNGETLVFENSQARHGWRPLDVRPLVSSESGFLLKEGGGYLLKEDGGKIILNQVEDMVFDNLMQRLGTEYGENLINRFTVTANPRRIDTSAQVLFKLDEKFAIASGQTVQFKGSFADPAGGLPVRGQNMIDPVPTTDYVMNAKKDGSGTNLTADLSVTPSYGTEGFQHTIKNTSNVTGWVQKFDCRGYGIYQYNPIEHAESDNDSRDEHGVQTESMDQQYQTQLYDGIVYAKKVVELERVPRTVVKEIEFVANLSNAMMMSFLTADCGLLIHATSDKYNVDSYFFVEGIKFTINPGGYIMFKMIVCQFLSFLLGLSQLAIDFGGYTTEDAVDFGYLPYVNNLTKRSFSMWVYPRSVESNQDLISIFGESAGMLIRIPVTGSSPGQPAIQVRSKMFANLDLWTANAVLTTDQWHHIVVTYDVTNYPSDPILYVDGTPTAWDSTSLSGGVPMEDETGIATIIGNENTANIPYLERALDGKMKDIRIYNRILSAEEVTTLYNGGTPDVSKVTDGMVFQAFAVRTKDLASYVDQTLTESLKVLDNVFGAVGTPHGAPVGRTP